MRWPHCKEQSFSLQYIKHSWGKGKENAPQTDSREWLIDTIKVTDKENYVGDYCRNHPAELVGALGTGKKKSFVGQMCLIGSMAGMVVLIAVIANKIGQFKF